ncbi:competence protein CoiA [Sporosarcina sp. FA9]|uniref:competence protein CoiA n=1 Tax=Sporosarcina sp. FA9 TaxID=3413030 RepID=UPI003F65E7E6
MLFCLSIRKIDVEEEGEAILTAKKEDGTIIILSSAMKKEQLRDWRKKINFFCPQCDDPVHLKVGDIVIPHFAHKSHANCSASFSEGETQIHLEGKRQLYEFFLKNRQEVKLEPYFSALSQRPDLLVTTDSNKVPIEFQCSPISINIMKLRTNGYLSAGMRPIWILLTPPKISLLPQGVSVFDFSKFHVNFFTYKTPEGLVFLTYNPLTKQFHYFSNLIHIGGKRYIGIHRVLPISLQIFPFARPKAATSNEINEYVKIYLTNRLKFLNSRVLLSRKGINDPFLRCCYELKIHPVELPFWIGLPLPFSTAFREHSCEWQIRLIRFLKRKGLRVSNLSIELARNFIRELDHPSYNQIKACLAYRDLLLSVGIDSLQDIGDFGEEKIVQLFAERLLAKRNEN